MIYVLIFGLIIMSIISYIYSGGMLLSVGMLTNLSFLASSLLMLLRVDKWQMQVSGKTVSIILLGNAMVMMGEIITLIWKRKRMGLPKDEAIITINYGNCIQVSVVMIGLSLLSLAFVLGTIRNYGVNAGLMAYRSSIADGEAQGQAISKYISIISSAVSYIFCFYCCYIKINLRKRIRFFHVLPVALSLFINFLSSSRYGFLTLGAGVFFIICCLLLDKNMWKSSVNYKLIRWSVMLCVLAIALFWFAGYATGKTGSGICHGKNRIGS